MSLAYDTGIFCLWFNHCREQYPREERPPMGGQGLGLWVPRLGPRMSLTAWWWKVQVQSVLTARGKLSAFGLSGGHRVTWDA